MGTQRDVGWLHGLLEAGVWRTCSAGEALLDLFKGSKRNQISSSTTSVWGRTDTGLDVGHPLSDSVGPGSALVATSLPGVLGYSMCRDDAPEEGSSASTRFQVVTLCPGRFGLPWVCGCLQHVSLALEVPFVLCQCFLSCNLFSALAQAVCW